VAPCGNRVAVHETKDSAAFQAAAGRWPLGAAVRCGMTQLPLGRTSYTGQSRSQCSSPTEDSWTTLLWTTSGQRSSVPRDAQWQPADLAHTLRVGGHRAPCARACPSKCPWKRWHAPVQVHTDPSRVRVCMGALCAGPQLYTRVAICSLHPHCLTGHLRVSIGAHAPSTRVRP
jgi:hypothetical protein